MQRIRRRLDISLHLVVRDVRLLGKRAVVEFLDDRCTQMAASISYWVFFSIFPLAIFIVTVTGQFLRDAELKERVIVALLEVLPLEAGEGRSMIERTLAGVTADVSLFGLFSIVGLIWSASAMMTAIRVSINVAWDHGYSRPALRGKLVDIGMVFVLGELVALSLVATTVVRIGTDIADSIPLMAVGWAWSVGTLFIPFMVSFGVFALLYRFVPVIKVRFSEIWPGALFAALAFELAKHGFGFYVANFGNYNAIYGSIGAIIVFLVFVYLASNILLFGAEIASEWPRVRAGHYDAVEGDDGDDDEDDRSTFERIRGLLGSLIFLDHQSNDEKQQARAEQHERLRRR